MQEYSVPKIRLSAILRAEALLAIVVGIILLNNLYIPVHAIGLDPGYFFAALGAVSGLFVLIRGRLANLLACQFNLFVIAVTLLSIVCFVLDTTVNGQVAADVNTVIRILCLALYFSWLLSLTHVIDSASVLLRLATWSFWIAVSMAMVHFLLMQIYPFLVDAAYNLLFAEQYLARISDRRVSGLFVDANYFASALTIFYLTVTYLRRRPGLIMFIAYAACINISGSRLGLVLLIVVSIHLFISLRASGRILTISAMLSAISVVLLIYATQQVSISYEQAGKNENVLARLLDPEVTAQARGSTNARLTSLVNGFVFSSEYNFLYGPGTINFASRWENRISGYVPHSVVVTVLAQFGVFAVIIYYLMLRMLIRAWFTGGLLLVLAFLSPVLLLPYFLYFPVAFYFLFLFEVLPQRQSLLLHAKRESIKERRPVGNLAKGEHGSSAHRTKRCVQVHSPRS